MFNKSKYGYVLLAVLILFPVLLLLIFTVINAVTSEGRFTIYEVNKKRAYYLADIALTSAYYEFSGQGYGRTTHEKDGKSPSNSQNKLQITLAGVSVNKNDGWYEWKWTKSSGYDNFMGENIPETFRYRIYYPDSNTWLIEGEGIYGTEKKLIQSTGYKQAAFEYAIFDNGDLGEFVRGANQTITGNIHVNGDLYFRPSGSTLTINSTQVTSSRSIIRFKDPWGRPDAGGTVQIKDANGKLQIMNGLSQGYSGQGKAFDTYNPLWTDTQKGAMAKWGGVVKDSTLGAKHVDPPGLQAFEPDGYYELNAGIKITPDTPDGNGIKQKIFYNKAEEHLETVKEIDLSVYKLPSNGLIYSKTPIRIVNGQKLSAPLTIVSNSNIYTIGDFNKVYGDKASKDKGIITKVPAALMTKGRIYHLSAQWDDKKNRNTGDKTPNGVDPPLYGGDEVKVIEINSALVDGTITVDERKYIKNYNDVKNPYYNEGTNVNANSDDFLENLSGITVKKRGSIIHLQNATMAKFDNSNYGPGINAWVIKSSYSAPVRDYNYDINLGTVTGQPPYSPYVGLKLYWKEIF